MTQSRNAILGPAALLCIVAILGIIGTRITNERNTSHSFQPAQAKPSPSSEAPLIAIPSRRTPDRAILATPEKQPLSPWVLPCQQPMPNLQAFRDCLNDAFTGSPPTVKEIADWACGTDLPLRKRSIVVQEVLLQMNPAYIAQFAMDFRSHCDLFAKRQFLANAIARACELNPGWAERIADSLTPEVLFDESKNTAAIELVAFLGKGKESLWAKNLVEEGGRGNFGSTAEQIEKAAVVSILIQDSPKQGFEYALSVLESPGVPGQARIGQSLVAFLSSPTGNCWQEKDGRLALDLIWSILDDPRFARESAVQLVHFTPEDAPEGANLGQWNTLRTKAQAVLDSYN